MPTMRGRNQLEAASGTMPRWENTKPKRASSEAMRISIASCMVTPMPTAGPSAAVADIGVAVIDLAIGQSFYRSAPRIAVESVGAGRKIGAGAEPAPGTGDDDGPAIVVLVGGIERIDQFLLHGAVEGVELVGPVQGDGENLLGDLVFDRLIGHRVFPLLLLFVSCIQGDRHGRACPGLSRPSTPFLPVRQC